MAEPGEWEIDEIMFDRYNTWQASKSEVTIWGNEMMKPDEGKINSFTGLPARYGTKSEPGSENIVRWCVNGGEEGDYMLINSDNPASGPYAMKFGMTEIPSGENCWLDIRRPDVVVPGYNIPFDASATGRVTFWIKAEPGTAPLWFMAQSFPPNYEPATNPDFSEKQLTVNAFIDGETVVMKDGTDELKVLRDNPWNGEWQFVSLPWEFLTMKDSAAVAEMLPWSLVWEGSAKDNDGDNTEFDVSRIRTLKWFPKPESDFLMNQYWNYDENLWGPPDIMAEPGEWEIDEIYFTSGYTPGYDGTTGVERKLADRIPVTYELHNAYPNPFNPRTTIRYAIPVSNQVKIEIYNVMGQKIRTLVDKHMSVGTHNIIWDARNDAGLKAPTGIYFVRMQSSHFSSTQKVTLIK